MTRLTIRRKPAPSNAAARKRIITVARGQFFAHGFRRFTMDDLAAELGMSKKTLYNTFPSKSDLLEAVIHEKLHDIQIAFNLVAAQRSSDFSNNLRQLLDCVQQISQELRPPFIRDMQRESPELFKLIESRRRVLIHHGFKGVFNQGRKRGMIRKDIPVTLMIEILLGSVQSMINPDKLAELKLDPKTAFSAVLGVLLEGVIIRSERPHR